MHSDNIEVVIYKILKYVYECQRKGVSPRPDDIRHNSELLGIPESYWVDIMHIIEKEQLLEGVTVLEIPDTDIHRVSMRRPLRITLKGSTFLEESSMMARAKDFLGLSFETFLKSMLALL